MDSQKIDTILASFSDKLGITTKEIFSYFIKQSTIEGYYNLIYYLGIILIVNILIIKYIKKNKENKDNYYGPNKKELLIILIIFNIFISLLILGNVIECFFNPEYHAIKLIFKLVK